MRNQRFLAGQVRLRIGRFGPGFIAFTANSRRTGFGLHPCSPLRHDHRVGGGKIRREGDRLQSHRASESHSPALSNPKPSSDTRRTPAFLGMAPINSGQKITHLCRRDRHRPVGNRWPQKSSSLQPFVSQLRMQTLRVHRCSLCGSRIHSTHCSGDGSPVSANDITGMANASCCRMTALRYGRFLRNGLIL